MGDGNCFTGNDTFFWGVMFGVFIVPMIRIAISRLLLIAE